MLVVDNQTDRREMLTEYRALRRFVVHQAADGLEAIDAATRVHPPNILMDLMMPRLAAIDHLAGWLHACVAGRLDFSTTGPAQ
jgi:CheY-like chemotaxis protein